MDHLWKGRQTAVGQLFNPHNEIQVPMRSLSRSVVCRFEDGATEGWHHDLYGEVCRLWPRCCLYAHPHCFQRWELREEAPTSVTERRVFFIYRRYLTQSNNNPNLHISLSVALLFSLWRSRRVEKERGKWEQESWSTDHNLACVTFTFFPSLCFFLTLPPETNWAQAKRFLSFPPPLSRFTCSVLPPFALSIMLRSM